MKPTRDPVTGYPAIEIGSNLIILPRETNPEEIKNFKLQDAETVLTPSDRGHPNLYKG